VNKKWIRDIIGLLPDSERYTKAALIPAFRAWQSAHQLPTVPAFVRREDLWEHVITHHVEAPVLYLEFGVYEGYSIRFFSERIRDPRSSFVGFDTFVGLPEAWLTYKAGTFDVGGRVPDIRDNRVSFMAGLFQETLGRFLSTVGDNRRLIVHCDADLYSSTLFVLTQLAPLLDGAVVVFDEFNALPHEFRALLDFSKAYRMSYRLLGYVNPSLDQAAVRFDAMQSV
jgi:hypothetical protein